MIAMLRIPSLGITNHHKGSPSKLRGNGMHTFRLLGFVAMWSSSINRGLKLLPNRSGPNAWFAGTVASNGLHRRSQKNEMWVFVHQYFGICPPIFLRLQTAWMDSVRSSPAT